MKEKVKREGQIEVERKRKVVVSREKAVNDVARIVETQMNLRQQRIDEATAKVIRKAMRDEPGRSGDGDG